MSKNEFISEYDTLITHFLSNEELINKIYENIAFVKKHLDKVDSTFKSDEEKQIAYRELGSIVCSCLEAVLKGAIARIDERCAQVECKEEECPYRSRLELLDELSLTRAINHLKDVRLIGLNDYDADALMKLIDLRNYTHISKHILNVNKDDMFNKEYVYEMFDCYYEFVDQLDMLVDYYFGSNRYFCLKEADGNDFEITRKMRSKEQKSFYKMKLHYLLEKALLDEKLSTDDLWYITRLDYSKFVNLDEVVEDIKEKVEYLCRNKNDPNLEKERMLSNLTKHLKRKAIIDRINAI